MGETDNRPILERLYERVWMGDAHDFAVMDEVFAEDAVLGFPSPGSGYGDARASGRSRRTIPSCPR